MGIALPSRASSRARSRVGSASTARSAATAIERLRHGAERDPARDQQDLKVVQAVRRLGDQPLVGLGGGGPRRLLRLLADLVSNPRRIVDQLHRVRAGGTGALPLEQGEL